MSVDGAGKAKGVTGWHVLWTLLMALAIVSAVNGIFIYKAVSTYSGDVALEPYRKGLHYNQRIEADERQAQLGWNSEIDLRGDQGPVVVTLRLAGGEPVTGLAVAGEMGRAATRHDDVKFTARETSPGVYEAPVQAGPGSWIVSFAAMRPGESQPAYRARKRFCLGSRLVVRDGLAICEK
jgi:nitrogen fixation protein FixH